MVKVLSIDDNEINLALINAILSKQTNIQKVYTSLCGKDGIQIAIKEKPDIILLDILMPDLSGFEVCKILKKNQATKHIPIIMVSALGNNTHDRIKSLDLGAEAIIAKPFDRQELISQVNVMLRFKFAEDSLRKQNEIQRKLLEEQSKDFELSDGRYVEISNYALEFFWEVNEDGMFTFISPVVEKILGYSKDIIIGSDYFHDFLLSNQKSKDNKISNAFLNRTNFREEEVKVISHNKKIVWLKITGYPVFDKYNNFSGYRGVSHDITQRKKTEEDLKKSLVKINTYQKKLKLLNSRLTQIEDEERRKIAEYLHDGIGQTLSLSQINLSSIQNNKLDPSVNEIIKNTIALIDDTIERTRTLTYDLSPPILNELGLIPAINWKLDKIKKEYDINTIINNESCNHNLKLETRTLIFRIISELLINIIKHAKATEIKVIIEKDNNFCKFTIIDNGIGFSFNPNKIEGRIGFGLFSISERIESLGGKFVIKSKANSGTKVILSLPI